MNQPAIIWQGDNLIIVVGNTPHTINKNTHPNYMDIVKCIQGKRWDDISDLLDINKKIMAWSNGDIKIENDVCTYRGRPVPLELGTMLLFLIKGKIDSDYFVKLIDNIMQNPSKRSVDQLYIFLEKNHMAITEDGCFMAYKAVEEGYMSKHCDEVTKEHVRYMIGDKPTMPRNYISDDPDNLCDAGLHVCSLNYLRGWNAKHLMLVKVNPKDVVSVPKDCNFTKMRVCALEVVAEVFDENGDPWYKQKDFSIDMAENYEDDEYEMDDDEIEQIRREAFDEGYSAGFDEGVDSLGD